ncbi:putativetranscriptional regulator [Patulibacter medicamentivorans]|uniref:Putativetranscriptional regulator n=1 Tax=Patulibacter medicamentivorans TaxID=1097667 RepID=H0E1R0_9ACTN|nr:helix-turn-helix domain-containing protein [Patulibacter medicamentivorans]EHN12403.1 putativetranscriptional regulator [Patulibacter medicamentivorans]
MADPDELLEQPTPEALAPDALLALERDGGWLGTRLQEIADGVADELRRPVAIDDRQLRLIVHTQHGDDLDRVRLDSILKRPLPADVVAWLETLGIHQARGAVRVPANPAFGMDARICVPIRGGGHLLGYLWLIDRDDDATDEQLARLERTADDAGVVLYRGLLLRDLDRGRERELVRDILSEDEGVRRQAVQQLVEFEIVERDGPSVVLVAATSAPPGAAGSSARAAALDTAIHRVRRHLTPKRALHLVRPGHVLLVVSGNETSVRRHGVAGLAAQVRQEIANAVDPAELPVLVAIGSQVDGLADARRSYHQAQRAAKVATLIRARFGEVVSWDELGIYRMLAELPLGDLDRLAIHPGLQTLLARPQTHFLVHTLECYLDRAGDVPAAAAELFVHRTTLYHRLRRIEELGAIDLGDGEQRLELHLGLKIARLQGLEWSTAAPPA